VFVFSERVFEVKNNPAGISKLCLFGEKLLHVELQTDYGKKEFVCANEKGILNHFMLKSLFDESDDIERNSAFCSYQIEGEKIKISLEDKETDEICQWSIDPVEETLVIAGKGGLGETVLSLREITENNGLTTD
jgi:hypothetical protein